MRIVGTIAVSAAVILGIAAATAAAVAHTHSDVPPGGAHGVGMDMNMSMAMAPATADLPALQLAHARIATAKYAGDLNAAKKAGYEILTQQIAGMGYHFINPAVKGFDVRKPPILVYEQARCPLAARRARVGLPEEARDASAEGCDVRLVPRGMSLQGRDVRARAERGHLCHDEPTSGSAFNFWHPALVTMHVWIWYPNPAGLYASMNPLVHSFS